MKKKITMLFAALLAVVGVAKADVTDLPQITTDLENPIYYTIYNTRSGSSGDRSFENGGLIYYAGDDQGIKDGRAAAAATLEDVYKFYFTGSYEELYIHNAAANGKKLKSATSWTDEGQAWMIAAKTNGLVIGPKGGDLEAAGSTNAGFLNEANYGQGFNSAWHSNDAGSLFAVELVEKQVYPITESFYFIECPLFFNKEGEHRGLYVDGTDVKWKAFDATDQSFYWVATVNDNGTVQLKNVKTGQWLNGNTTSETAVDATIKPLGDNQFGIKVNDYVIHANGHGEGFNDSGVLANWAQIANSPSAWCFVQKQDPTTLQEVVVKYSFTYGGEEKYAQEVNTLVGEEWPAITVSFPYGVSSATKPAGNISESDVVGDVVTKVIELEIEHELPFVAAADVNSIDTWYYVQMHANSAVTAYVQDDQNANNNVEWADKSVDAAEIDSHLWGFAGDVWSGIKMVNKGTERAIVSTSGAAVMGDAANATAFIPVYSNGAYRNGWFCLKYPESNYLNAQEGKIASWSDADNGSSFKLTKYQEKEVAISEAGYSTLYLDYATYIPEGVEVYAVSAIENGYVALEAVEGDVLPANTGVILKNKGEYTFKAAGATSEATSLLSGSATDTYVEGTAYVLANGTQGVGLYKAELNKAANGAEGTTHFKNNANKAYLVLPAQAEAPAMFSLGRGEGTTGIETAVSGEQTVVIYDLAGRRVEKMEKGIYIVNGKKVIR